MPRPRKRKKIQEATDFIYGCRRYQETVTMTHEQLETIRLIDMNKLSQEDAAQQMAVSRATVQALYKQARETIAEAILTQKNIQVSGGDYEVLPKQNEHDHHECRHQGKHHERHHHNDEHHHE